MCVCVHACVCVCDLCFSACLVLPASLIELLAEVLDAEMSLFGKRILTVEEWLKRYLKVRASCDLD